MGCKDEIRQIEKACRAAAFRAVIGAIGEGLFSFAGAAVIFAAICWWLSDPNF